MKIIIIKLNIKLDECQRQFFEDKCKTDIKSGLLILPEWCDAFVVEDVTGTEVKL